MGGVEVCSASMCWYRDIQCVVVMNITEYRQGLHEKILVTAMTEFNKHGISAVKMDEIARMLSISKRTLYEIYSNKEELLFAGVKRNEEYFHHHMMEYAGEHDVIEIIVEFYMLQIRRLSEITLQFFIDIEKYRRIVDFLSEKREQHRKSSVLFFSQGVTDGYFRKDVDFDLVNHIGNAVMEYVMRAKLYETYSIDYIFRNIIVMFVRGICTQKGIEKIDKLLDSI